MPYTHNDELRDVLARHFNDYEIRDSGQNLQVSGWLKSSGVRVQVSGLRHRVVDTVEALVRTLLAAERLES